MIQFMPNYWLIMFLINMMFFFFLYINLYYNKKFKF